MKPKRKRGNSTAKEGWNVREESLGDFLPSPGISLSQQNAIVWSSSDDEEDSLSEAKTCMPGVQKLAPASKKLHCAFPQEITDYYGRRKLKVLKDSSLKGGVISLVSKPVEVVKCNSVAVIKETKLVPENAAASSNKFHKLQNEQTPIVSFVGRIKKGIHEINNDLCMDTLRTPSKGEYQIKRSKDFDISDISPVLGSQHTHSISKKQSNLNLKNIFVCAEAVQEPSSPILGLTDNAKEFKEPTSPVLTLVDNGKDFREPTSPVLGLKDNRKDFSEPLSPVLGSSERSIKRRTGKMRHRSNCHLISLKEDSISPTLVSNKNVNPCMILTPKWHEAPANIYEKQLKMKVKGKNLCELFSEEYSTKPDVKNDGISSHPPVVEREVPIPRRKHMLHFDDVILSQEDHVDEHIDTQSSSSDAEDQPDAGIDFIESSFQDTQPEWTKVSEGSGEPSISVGSVISPEDDDDVDAGESLKTGSDWIRTIQQRTPEKPTCQPKPEVTVESTKKKIRKDGHAERLRRLIQSWQSGVQMWAHQISVGSPEIRAPRIEETAVKLFSPGSAKDLIKKELHYENPSKGLFSPGVRNLQNFLIDSPRSSPGIFEKAKIDLLPAKKFLNLIILEIGKKLPSNAALCEVVYDCSKGPQDKIKEEAHRRDHRGRSVCKLGGSLQYLVFFSFLDRKVHTTLRVSDEVKVYSPWQLLDLPTNKIPVLFTSYFTISKESCIKEKLCSSIQKVKREKEEPCKRKRSPKNTKDSKAKLVLVTWSCSCMTDSTILPSMCEARQCMAERSVWYKDGADSRGLTPGFRVVKDASQEYQQGEAQPAWTVLEAIEKCGGVSDMQVTISVRAHRVISHSNSKGVIEQWEVVGQDASGIFCSVRIPNRPLVRQLTRVIEEGEGTTWTITHVNVVQRLTNTQSPGLFSLISSLHHCYQKTVKEDPLLYPLLADHVSSSPQTYCYVFNVTLGATEVLDCLQEVVIPVSLPFFSLREIPLVTTDGQRGSVCLYILYKVGNLLYAMSQEEESSGWECVKQQISPNTSKRESYCPKSLNKKNASVMVIAVSSKAILPRWIPDSGTVMINALVKDIVVWHGKATVDEYSSIRPQKSEFEVSLSTLVKVLEPLSPSSNCHDLTVVSGAIQKVDEETAYTWLSCSKCGSADVHERQGGGGGDCYACGQTISKLDTEYYMEIWVNCGSSLQHADVKVKLYQAAIKKLLTSCHGAEQEVYDAGTFVGRHIGPMVCILEEVKRSKRTQCHSYRLLQLPY